MKILYGVQATGNGHITRARAMNKYFKAQDIEVDYLFSGRERKAFFDMDEFGSWRCYRGLTFYHESGSLKVMQTLKRNSLKEFWRDLRSISVSEYDLVLSDFEPLSAWACKLANKTCVGIGHQYAFDFSVPKIGGNYVPKLLMKVFAPVSLGLGLHWHHFGQPILPPIAETHEISKATDPNKIVVYLGFEKAEDVISLLEPFENHLFVFYGPFKQYESRGHIQLKPLSREGFQQDLASAGGVICNAGFELSSEALQLGKKLLVKPLSGQLEQLSNGVALEKLGLGMTMSSLDASVVEKWLTQWQGKRVFYPNVAEAIVAWIGKGDWRSRQSRDELALALWQQTTAPGIASFDDDPLPRAVKSRLQNKT